MTDALADLCRALADPARLALVRALASAERDAGSLARATRSSASATSNRLAALAAAGLVDVRASGRRRVYRLRHPETRRTLARMEAFAAICAASR